MLEKNEQAPQKITLSKSQMKRRRMKKIKLKQKAKDSRESRENRK